MGDTIWAKRITRNLSEIKDRASVVLDQIIDFLIENGILQLNRRSEVDAIVGPSAKIDHILQLVLSYGEKAYDVLLEAFEKHGLEDLADMIRFTDVLLSEGSGEALFGHHDDDDWLDRSFKICSDDDSQMSTSRSTDRSETFEKMMISRTQTLLARVENLESSRADEKRELHSERDSIKREKHELSNERVKLRNENEAFYRKMESHMYKEREYLRKEREELQLENKKMNVKFQELADEFSRFKSQASQENAEKNRRIEKLQKRNRELQQEVENMKRRLTGKSAECDDLRKQRLEMKVKLDQKNMALQIIDNYLQNTVEGKHTKHMIEKRLGTCKLPPIIGQPARATKSQTKKK